MGSTGAALGQGGSTQPADAAAGAPKEANLARVSFVNRVMPVINRFGCNSASCHGTLKGQGGLKLSLFGAEPESDYETLTKSAAGRYINRMEPAKSYLLLKATGKIPHKSPKPLDPEARDYKLLLDWLSQGTSYVGENEPQLLSVVASTREQLLQPGESGQITLTATYSDGSKRDVTREVSSTSSDEKVAAMAGNGKIRAAAPGEAVIVASYLRKSDTVRVMVPQPASGAFPKLEANNKIDELVYAKLKRLGIPPSGLCSDPEFLRRVYLEVIGILPTPDEARAFLADSSPDKRAKLIDRLMGREEYADFWALKWGDLLRIKSEYPVRVWPKGVETYYRWVRESLAKNKPYDQFVRELLLSDGSDFRDGPANFYRALPSKDPQSVGENVALVFMGTRLGCARCHGHPTENWGLKDDLGMGAFFSRVAYKSTLEWKEEIVYFNPKGALKDPLTKQPVMPKFLDGPSVKLGNEEDPRVKFTDWLMAPENPWFSTAITNRIWFWLFARGIVHEPDDLRPTNPPENPELLEYLAKELTSHRYDLRHIFRLILNSRTWQLSSVTTASNSRDLAHFSHHTITRLGAEQLSDAICQITETSEKFQSIIPEPFTFLPPGHRATQLSDGNIGTAFLELFGRPSRDTPYESERNTDTSIWQALYLINSDQLENKLTNSPRIKRLLSANKSDDEIIDEFYLATLARLPAKEERLKVAAYLATNKAARAKAVGDVLWALLNTKEFMFIR